MSDLTSNPRVSTFILKAAKKLISRVILTNAPICGTLVMENIVVTSQLYLSPYTLLNIFRVS